MEMTFSNKAMQAMQGFGIQLNKNSFGMTSSQPLNIPLLNAGQTLDVALPMTCTGPVQKMDPLTNIQVLFYMYKELCIPTMAVKIFTHFVFLGRCEEQH